MLPRAHAFSPAKYDTDAGQEPEVEQRGRHDQKLLLRPNVNSRDRIYPVMALGVRDERADRPAEHVLVHRVQRRQRDARDPQAPSCRQRRRCCRDRRSREPRVWDPRPRRSMQSARARARDDSECDPHGEYRTDTARLQVRRTGVRSGRRGRLGHPHVHEPRLCICRLDGRERAGSAGTRDRKCHTRQFATQRYRGAAHDRQRPDRRRRPEHGRDAHQGDDAPRLRRDVEDVRRTRP